MIKPYERKINYYETDQMGIVHHSNYIRYLEETRLYYMNQQGLSYEYVEKMGVIIPVLAVSVEYQSAVRYGDTILISQRITKFSPVKFQIEYEIRNKETKKLHAVAHSKHCFVDKELKPIRLKKDFPLIYQNFFMVAETDRENSSGFG